MPYLDKDKQREYQRLWRAKRRADYLADKSCAQCGSCDRLEVDHIDPATKLTHNVWSWTEKRREAELAKCQVLCYTCHKEKTSQWYVDNRKHNITAYNHGCRCPICFAAQQKHNAQRYA